MSDGVSQLAVKVSSNHAQVMRQYLAECGAWDDSRRLQQAGTSHVLIPVSDKITTVQRSSTCGLSHSHRDCPSPPVTSKTSIGFEPKEDEHSESDPTDSLIYLGGIDGTVVQASLPLSRRSNLETPHLTLKRRLREFVTARGIPWTRELTSEVPRHWECHGDMVLLPKSSFKSTVWAAEWRLEGLWQLVADSLKCKRLAKKSRIRSDDYRTPNVELLLGVDTWVQHMDSGIRYCYDIQHCMFSAGNITEKIRVGAFDCQGENVVDLFAGIGYFTLPYLVHARASFVHACEWNPRAVAALEKTLDLNGVRDRCKIHYGDNRKACPKSVADRINLGLIPSSESSWLVACRALKPSGGMMHVHGNVESAGDSQKNEWSIVCDGTLSQESLEANVSRLKLGDKPPSPSQDGEGVIETAVACHTFETSGDIVHHDVENSKDSHKNGLGAVSHGTIPHVSSVYNVSMLENESVSPSQDSKELVHHPLKTTGGTVHSNMELNGPSTGCNVSTPLYVSSQTITSLEKGSLGHLKEDVSIVDMDEGGSCSALKRTGETMYDLGIEQSLRDAYKDGLSTVCNGTLSHDPPDSYSCLRQDSGQSVPSLESKSQDSWQCVDKDLASCDSMSHDCGAIIDGDTNVSGMQDRLLTANHSDVEIQNREEECLIQSGNKRQLRDLKDNLKEGCGTNTEMQNQQEAGVEDLDVKFSEMNITSSKPLKSEWLKWANYVHVKMRALLQETHKGSWEVMVCHIERVKSYAPHVDHLVVDIRCWPTDHD